MKTAFLYNEIFRNSDYGKSHPVTINRVTNVYDFSKLINLKDSVDYFYNDFATFSQLASFHTPDYIKILKLTEKKQYIEKELAIKYNLGSPDNPVFTEMYRRHAAATGALILATELIKREYNYIFSPGSGAHHAKHNKASGFCYFNDIAICILELKKKGFSKILYFDMDAHYGDGVVEYFRKDQEVMTVSMHQEDLWPKKNIFEFDKDFNVINVPLRRGFNDQDFLKLFHEDFFYPLMLSFRPEIVLMQMGADCLKDDSFSDLDLSNNSMMYAIKQIKKISTNIIVMGGGGYNPWITLRAWIYNLATLVGMDDYLNLDKNAKNFLKKIKWKEKPKEIWINTIKDEPNIF